MATLPNSETLWTVQEYLSTSWHPDREYLDGRIEERNLGEKEHSILQRYFTFLFMLMRDDWRVEVFPELRTQIGATNFRVPDVCVVRSGEGFDHILTHPPLIAIEILSPKDRLRQMEEKARQYAQFGVEHIWVIDPAKRKTYQYEPGQHESGTLQLVENGELAVAGTAIRVVLAEMFAELDRT